MCPLGEYMYSLPLHSEACRNHVLCLLLSPSASWHQSPFWFPPTRQPYKNTCRTFDRLWQHRGDRPCFLSCIASVVKLSQNLDNSHLEIITAHWERSEQKNSFSQSYSFSGVLEVSNDQDTPSHLGDLWVSTLLACILSLVHMWIACLGSCNRIDTQANLWISDRGKASALLTRDHSFIQKPDV